MKKPRRRTRPAWEPLRGDLKKVYTGSEGLVKRFYQIG